MNIDQFIEKDYNRVFDELQDYILNKPNIEKINLLKTELITTLKNNTNNTNNTNSNTKITITKNNSDIGGKKFDISKTFFYPKEKDSLFWCFYIMKNELLHYQMLNNRNIVFEKTQKIEYIEKIRKEKHIIKNYKFASICNIESNLVNDMNIDTFSFLTLCVIENINVIFIQRKTYYELRMNDNNDVFVIKKNENDKYGVELIQKTDSAYENYKNDYYKIENLDKPIKSITYYKVDDLISICAKLSIESIHKETGKQKSKKDLYESIIQKL